MGPHRSISVFYYCYLVSNGEEEMEKKRWRRRDGEEEMEKKMMSNEDGDGEEDDEMEMVMRWRRRW